MTIGIDISQIVYEGTGVSRFTQGLVQSILEYDNSNQWVFFFSALRRKLNPALAKRIESKGHRLVTFPFPPTLLSYLWNDLHKNIFTKNAFNNLDWFISSDWAEPPVGIKKATIVHDLVFKRFPETVDAKILKTQEKRLSWIAKESNIIFTDSQSTADDLLQFYPVKKENIVLNYPGVEVHQVATSYDVKQKFAITKPFILSVGKIEPRKNLKRLIEAFVQLPANEFQLIIAGPPGWGEMEPVTNTDIRFLGYVSDEELSLLYQSAMCFTYPSLYEGFGYPVVEAMQSGCPVITSDTSSLKEIGSEGAAMLIDPTNVDAIKQAILEISNNQDLRNKLILKGKEKSKEFTWKKYYNRMIEQLRQ